VGGRGGGDKGGGECREVEGAVREEQEREAGRERAERESKRE